MTKNYPGIGTSRYRQLRITATHELNGRFSYSIYAKGLAQEWHERQCLVRGAIDGTRYGLQTSEDVLMALVHVIESHMLPGIEGAALGEPAPPRAARSPLGGYGGDA